MGSLNGSLFVSAIIEKLIAGMQTVTGGDITAGTIKDYQDEYNARHNNANDTDLVLRPVKQWLRKRPTEAGALQQGTTPAVIVMTPEIDQPNEEFVRIDEYQFQVDIDIALVGNEKMTQVISGETLNLTVQESMGVKLEAYVAALMAVLEPYNNGTAYLREINSTTENAVATLRYIDTTYLPTFIGEQGERFMQVATISYAALMENC